MTYLFTYGTLMKTHPKSRHELLGDNPKPIGKGQVRGRLLFQSDFPALINDKEQWVEGEVYEIPEENLWEQIDDWEGEEYERKRTLVLMEDEREVEAWVYYYTDYEIQ